MPQVVLQVHPECPCVGACLSLWDDSLLAVAGLHIVKAYRFDIRTGSTKSSNAVMLVSTLSDASGWLGGCRHARQLKVTAAPWQARLPCVLCNRRPAVGCVPESLLVHTLQDSHKSTTITCLCHLVGGMLAVGTSTGKIMVCSTTGVLSVHDIAPAGSSSQDTSLSGAHTPHLYDDTPATPGSRSRSVSGAAHTALASPSSAAGTPKGRKSSLVPPWQEVLKEVGRASQPAAAGLYAVQAVVQRGRGFVAVGSQGDLYLFNPAGGRG